MVCAFVRDDNPRALASGLTHIHTQNHTKTAKLVDYPPVHTHNHTITAVLHQHACAHWSL